MVLRVAMNRRRWLTKSLLCLLGVMMLGGSAFSVEQEARFFVMRDGRKLPLRESTTEYGVIFHDVQSVDASAARLLAKTGAKVRDFSGKRQSRVKLLQVDKTSAATRALIAQDPAVAEVHPTYYYPNAPQCCIGTGTFLARVRPGIDGKQLQTLWDDFGATVVRQVPGVRSTYLLRPSNMDELLCAEKMADDARTVWAQPNFRSPVEKRQIAPSDEYFSYQWHHENTGQGGGTPGADIKTVEAWTIANGQDITIGMFDDACDVNHPDLRQGYTGIGQDASLDANANGADDPSPKQPNDTHGTQVMGLAVGRANSIGGRGVAYQSQFTASRGLIAGTTDEQVALTYVFARQQEVDVHINSWGFVPPIPNPAVIEDQIEAAYTLGRDKGDLDGDDVADPLGMVILFASGNDDIENQVGFELSTLPTVIAVGASHDGDRRASYSNYGNTLNFLAPSGDDFRSGLFTTDNRDTSEIANPGVNIGGLNSDTPGFVFAEIDETGDYTQYFGGTSGACPIAAGVAALVLSVNPLLTANDVRIIMEHTSDPVNPANADYHGITRRSLKYGYGRINAKAAVDAAVQSQTTQRSWPDPPADVTLGTAQIEWRRNTGTEEFMIVESTAPFDFIPEDGVCYDASQLGCNANSVVALPDGVTLSAIGCDQLSCTAGATNLCEDADGGEDHCMGFLLPSGKKYFGLYARSAFGRYSFGVAIDSDGNVTDSGIIVGDPTSGVVGSTPGGGNVTVGAPAVTIRATPVEGESPLSVQFQGNAVSESAIDESRTAWDFDTSDSTLVDSRNRTAVRTYTVEPGRTQTFTATLTMFDVDGNSGSAEVVIRVDGEETEASSGALQNEDVNISIGTVNNPEADITTGISPLSVLLSVDAASLAGELDSVTWDLGDGAKSTSLSVPHTYTNNSGRTQRVAITASITSVTSLGVTTTTSTTRFLTIESGTTSTETSTPSLPGAGVSGGNSTASPCGVVSMITMLGMGGILLSMRLVLRKRRRW